jgi:hypothetical protein
LTLNQFKHFLRAAHININDERILINFMNLLDSKINKNIIRHLPLISKLSNYVNIFNQSQVVHKVVNFTDNSIAETLFKIKDLQIYEADVDYDGKLEAT